MPNINNKKKIQMKQRPLMKPLPQKKEFILKIQQLLSIIIIT